MNSDAPTKRATGRKHARPDEKGAPRVSSNKAPAPAPHYTPRKSFDIQGRGLVHDEIGRNVAAVATGPETAAARVIQAAERKASLDEHLDLPTLAATLRDHAAAVRAGSLSQAEAILINQATALQSLFARLAERGMSSDSIPGFEANMRMALRAQSQCRAALETLAEIKNPPLLYARQANVTTGPQQVNNGALASPPPRTRESEPEANRLLEEIDHGQWLDTRAPRAAGAADPHLATVGAVDRADDTGG